MIFDDKGIFGFDVSKWQRDATVTPAKEIDFGLMKLSGTSFVIMKAGQYNFTDPGFLYNWQACRDAGIPRGSYWFLDARDNGVNQAKRHWELIKNDIGEGIHAIDFEFGSDHKLDSVYNFLNEFQQLSGLPNEKLAVYTSYYYWIEATQTSFAQRGWFGQFPLWLAWYASSPTIPIVPYPWTQCVLWQEGTPSIGLSVGVRSKEIDRNRLNGDRDILVKHFGGLIPPDEGEEEMSYYEVRSTNAAEYRTIRTGPRVTFPGVTTLPAGTNSMAKARTDDVFNYTIDSYDGAILRAKAGDQWVHVYEVNGVIKDGWIAVRHLGVPYTVLTLRDITPTPTTEYILHVKDGVTTKFVPEV